MGISHLTRPRAIMLETNGILLLGSTLVILSSSAGVNTLGSGIMDAAATPRMVTTATMATTTAAQVTTMVVDGVIRIPATIQAGLTDRIATIRIRTTGDTRTVIHTTAEAMPMALEPLQPSSAVWVSLASIMA